MIPTASVLRGFSYNGVIEQITTDLTVKCPQDKETLCADGSPLHEKGTRSTTRERELLTAGRGSATRGRGLFTGAFICSFK